MNSVFSAFKTNKNDKQRSLLGSKKISNVPENSYENLRHIREIGSNSKTMTSIVNDDVEQNLVNIRATIPVLKNTLLNENDCLPSTSLSSSSLPSLTLSSTSGSGNDVVDYMTTSNRQFSSSFPVDSCNSINVMKQNMTTDNCKLTLENILQTNSVVTNNKSNGHQPLSSSYECDISLNPKSFSSSTSPSSSSSLSTITSKSINMTATSTKTSSILDCNTEINNIISNENNIPLPNSPTTTLSRCSSSCSNTSSNTNTSCEQLTAIAVSSSTSSLTTDTSNSAICNSKTIIAMAPNDKIGNNSNKDIIDAIKASVNGVVFSENHTPPIIMSKCRNNSSNPQISSTTASNSATTTPKNSRYSKPRLSLSGFSNNNSIPSVHGRSGNTALSTTNLNRGQQQTRTRLSTHQRNLSLDFRSMGILLPPVSQVTNTRINVTQHHRNRSLDSALQRIPEVEVSSPNAETETTFCTNSILGSTMCSKIVSSSSTSVPQQPLIASQSKSPEILNNINNLSSEESNINSIEPRVQSKLNSNSPAELSIVNNSNNNKVVSENKKREDLTSLGSDDSGIICGSESDQVSLNRVRQSHESLDSGEMDAEEECIEILETTSMDEEYKMLQSDLCFYQQSTDKDMMTLTRSSSSKNYRKSDKLESTNDNKKLFVPIDIDIQSKDHSITPDTIIDDTTPTPTEESTNNKSNELSKNTNISLNNSSAKSSVTVSPTNETETKSEHIKNEILFKNFFGATKNAIFRTAQSIIENHEKKNSSKNKSDDTSSSAGTDIKSPTEISKKKEFFVLKSSLSSKNKMTTPSSIATTPSEQLTVTTPEIEIKSITTKSFSGNSLPRLKVPGVVKCFIKEKEQQQLQQQHSIKTEKGGHHSGLLRFFESPVFNIHFAIHYLFYSKEPGVLSFIGNKIFSFSDHNVDLYIPQLIVMYIQMDELAEVLDPYLTYRCKKSVDFSLKCLWLLEAYNYNLDTLSPTTSSSNKKTHLSLMKELRKERKQLKVSHGIPTATITTEMLSPIKKTHHRSQSDATGLLNDSKRFPSSGALTLAGKMYPPTPAKLCLGDLTSGKAFDNGCTCFESVQGTVNDLRGRKTVCCCGAPKMAAQKEFMKSLINIGKNLTSLQTKAEKTSALRLFLNLINKNLPARVWLPLHSDIPHHIVRITEEKTAVLNSKDKTPYIIYVEVVEVNDIYSSPVIMKMMPTLRHTKSEEHLETKNDGNLTSTKTKPTSIEEKVISTMEILPSVKIDNKMNKIIGDGKENKGSSIESTDTKVIKKNNDGNVVGQKISESSSSNSDNYTKVDLNELNFTEDDVWSQEDDDITAQYLNLHKTSERDAISQMSLDSCDSRDQGIPTLFNIGDVRTRHCNNLSCENTKPFSHDPEDPSAAALKEPWHEKEKQIRESSPYGHLSNWRLLSAIVKCGDDLRQELMATQLLEMFKIIWQEENIDLWVRPYKIVCLSNDSGLIEPILNTVSLHQIKKNSNKSLRDYFIDEYGDIESTKFKKAQRNFMQSCAAYCLISYLLQVKDRHNGNILLHSDGHLIHIDFGFILSISPKNLGFEQSPFKLTPEFVDVMGGTSSELWLEFNHSLLKGLMAARKHMDRIINLVEIMRSNAQLPCFKNGCSGTVQNLRKRFHMNLTEQELEKKVEQLVQDSLKSLSTKLYDGYQYFTNGIL